MSDKSSLKFAFSYQPKTKNQVAAGKAFSQSQVLFLNGSAGTGKSFCALALALKEVHEGRARQVIYVRPTIEAGASIGYVPGDKHEKYEPYLGAVGPILKKLVFKLPPDIIRYELLAFMRSLTFDDCVAVLDESQNATKSQIKLFLTRMGKDCKIIVAGDCEQSDINPTQPDYFCDLDWVMDKLEGVKGVSILDFDPSQVLRHPLVAEFTKRL